MIAEVTMYILNQQIFSHLQKTCNELIIDPNFMNVFYDNVVCIPLILYSFLSRKEK